MKRWTTVGIGPLILALVLATAAAAQTAAIGQAGASAAAAKSVIVGTVADANHEALPGAKIRLEPSNLSTASGIHGDFKLSGIAPATYRLTVSYLGFSPATETVLVTAAQVAHVAVVLQVASQSQEVIVQAPQLRGEAELINLERTTPNILDVLPAKLIASLPNANIADAVGRLPGVTLERDEGEGKYVQLRGTEPRLSNLTVDGVAVPSPEPGVRQIKLDVIPADLVQSVQIFKTLQADQPGNAIGGSVNIQTKTPGSQPILTLYGNGGFTPIDRTVPVYEFGLTAGQRLGAHQRLGVLFGTSFDYNGRGINDIEPMPVILAGTAMTPAFTSMDVRDYRYDRKRYGMGGDVDYRLGGNSTLWLRGLFSDFEDFGNRYDYALATNDTVPGPNLPSFNTERRLGDYQIANVSIGGNHSSGNWVFNWKGSAARSRMLNPINGGESITSFTFVPATSNCQYLAGATTNSYLPRFSSACFDEMYNPANFQLANISLANHGLSAQVNLQASASASRGYFLGSHPAVFQFGGAFGNAHKFDDSFENDYAPNGTVLMSQFPDGYRNSDYYFGGNTYSFGPGVGWGAANAFLAAHPSFFTETTTAGGNSNNFDLIESISAGYLMNTVNLGRYTLYAGLRVERTHDDTRSFDTTLAVPCLCAKGANAYADLLPSASLAFNIDSNSDLRLAYFRGISRPDPQFLTTATSLDSSTFPPTVTIGNPTLKPEHANDYDLLYERFLKPLGVVRGGFFYKNLSNPIVNLLLGPEPAAACPQPNCFVSQAGNAGTAYIAGLELSFDQRLTYLPGLLGNLGLFANYSYATSRAHQVNPGNRSDSPALLRQAPSTWNVSPTFDRGPLSLRAGLAYNGPNIYQYSFLTGNPGGLAGPGGDVYLFAHFQVDAQASYRLSNGMTLLFQGLNLNNAVFGFYNGSPQFFIQREYYRPTYSVGVRWTLGER